MKLLDILYLAPLATAFTPIKLHDRLKSHPSISHEALTINVLSDIAFAHDKICSNPNCANGSVQLPQEVVSAIQTVARANAEADIYHETHDAAWRFGDGDIYEGQQLLAALREAIVASLEKDDGNTAQILLGKALRGVQDFCAHMNWLELDHSKLSLLRRDSLAAVKLTSDHGSSAPETANEPLASEKTLQANFTVSTHVLPLSTGTLSINSTSPGPVPIFGVSSTTGAISKPNKDSLDSSCSPPNQLYLDTAAFATAATQQFIDNLIDEISPQQLRALFSLPTETQYSSNEPPVKRRHDLSRLASTTLHIDGVVSSHSIDKRGSSEIREPYNPLKLISLSPILLVADALPMLDSPLSFPFVVDSQMTFLSVGISCNGCSVSLSPPNAKSLTESDWNQAVDESGTHASMNVIAPQPGVWSLELPRNNNSKNGTFAVAVGGKSCLQLLGFSFVESVGRFGHEGYFDIGSKPPVDMLLEVDAELYGPVGSSDPLWVLRSPNYHGLRNESVAETREPQIPALQLTAGSDGNDFTDEHIFLGPTKLPKSFLKMDRYGGKIKTFFVYVRGVDSFGADFQRVYPVLFQPSPATRAYSKGNPAPSAESSTGIFRTLNDRQAVDRRRALKKSAHEWNNHAVSASVDIRADGVNTLPPWSLAQPGPSQNATALLSPTNHEVPAFSTVTWPRLNFTSRPHVGDLRTLTTGGSFFNPTGLSTPREATIIPKPFESLSSYRIKVSSPSDSSGKNSFEPTTTLSSAAEVATTETPTMKSTSTNMYNEYHTVTVTHCLDWDSLTTAVTSMISTETLGDNYNAASGGYGSFVPNEYPEVSPLTLSTIATAAPIELSRNSPLTTEVKSSLTLTLTVTRTRTVSTSTYGSIGTTSAFYGNSFVSSNHSIEHTRTTSTDAAELSIIQSAAIEIGASIYGALVVAVATMMFVLA
ncbi:uncharacterized protein BROUX77_002045 [Berkeleyomyces rouxiae]|uniref:uncharacterized protein n=1 Tax=Berkeleyomyces rouxiae TaxID=2035830 RepID=UPI003B7F4BD8